MTIRYANEDDHNYLAANDHHVQAEIIAKKIKDSEIIVVAVIRLWRGTTIRVIIATTLPTIVLIATTPISSK